LKSKTIWELDRLPPLLTVPQIIALRHCHTATIRRARAAGRLKAVKVNERVYLYQRDSVLAWLGMPFSKGAVANSRKKKAATGQATEAAQAAARALEGSNT
jgi:hypothetical protein